ncbi:hypothetical protein FHS61_003033 [Altererythrobacter atlanticus]|uniref:Uncharacterized protein n=1 Tax=Croceibacterium atlanticum TaxID=1267766 RepID=A0A0F7KSF6_9SPHN|nr:DUF6644 family protein [Croceibacterium atlanticum]AKH42202.1 hypothetical protein WYH_01156 [Croceibacterium atlanticum]MBB5733986.1 hypothetical protein [Croceibacterium atlanticum]
MGDLLYNMTEWLRTTQLVELALWISETPLNLWIVTNFWAIPVLQVIHILSIAGAFGAILMINLRIFGAGGGHLTMLDLSKRYVPWVWWSLLMLAISGSFMIIGEPIRELINPIFWIKMVLLVVAILFSLWFHNGVIKRAEANGSVSSAARGGAIFVIILWCAIIFCGRWIAYAPV